MTENQFLGNSLPLDDDLLFICLAVTCPSEEMREGRDYITELKAAKSPKLWN